MKAPIVIHKKLDRRMKGYGEFKYTAQFTLREKDQFCDMREWCWNQWGASCEFDFWSNTKNPTWCWISDQYRIQLYFSSDKEYQWFLLKWT
jgi:hypothetical protein